MIYENIALWDFPGSLVVMTSPSNARNMDSTSGWGANILHASAKKSKHETEAIL